jgi:hypothetical protein
MDNINMLLSQEDQISQLVVTDNAVSKKDTDTILY